MPLLGTLDITSKGWVLCRKNLKNVWMHTKSELLILAGIIVINTIGSVLMNTDQITGVFTIGLIITIASVLALIPYAIVVVVKIMALLWKDYANEERPIQPWSLVIPFIGISVLSTLAIMGGLILLIIPGIIFSIWFQFAINALVIDNQRGTTALSFSKQLVKGRFWKVFGRTLLLGLIFGIFSLIFDLPSMAIDLIQPYILNASNLEGTMHVVLTMIITTLMALVSAVGSYIYFVFSTGSNLIFYHNLKTTKEETGAIPSQATL